MTRFKLMPQSRIARDLLYLCIIAWLVLVVIVVAAFHTLEGSNMDTSIAWVSLATGMTGLSAGFALSSVLVESRILSFQKASK